MLPNANKPVFTLLSRPECHLCEAFVEELEAALPGRLSLAVADVDSRPDWQAKYGLQIPVLLDQSGAVVCAGRFDEEATQKAVSRAL